LSACAGTLGLVAYYFLMVSPISIVANLFIVPLLSLVIASGLLFISLGTLVPALCPILALNCEFFISLIYRIANFLVGLPGAYFEFSQINVIYIYLYYIVLAVVFYAKDISRLLKKLF
jgi:competence protein ComEC